MANPVLSSARSRTLAATITAVAATTGRDNKKAAAVPEEEMEAKEPVMGKHPDLMVAHPTSTIFPTIGRNF